MRDAGDIMKEISFSERLQYSREMGTILAELEARGALAYRDKANQKL
jgi:hypothetical protein